MQTCYQMRNKSTFEVCGGRFSRETERDSGVRSFNGKGLVLVVLKSRIRGLRLIIEGNGNGRIGGVFFTSGDLNQRNDLNQRKGLNQWSKPAPLPAPCSLLP